MVEHVKIFSMISSVYVLQALLIDSVKLVSTQI